MSCDFRPLMLTTKPTPHESCSLRGSYSPGPAGDPIIVPSIASVFADMASPSRAGRVANAYVSLRFAALQRPRWSRQRLGLPSAGAVRASETGNLVARSWFGLALNHPRPARAIPWACLRDGREGAGTGDYQGVGFVGRVRAVAGAVLLNLRRRPDSGYPARGRLPRVGAFATRRLAGACGGAFSGFRPRPIFFASEDRTLA